MSPRAPTLRSGILAGTGPGQVTLSLDREMEPDSLV